MWFSVNPDRGARLSFATGVGHDDLGLQRTYRDLQRLLEQSPTDEIFCSDACGWDLSVSAMTFWSAWEAKVRRSNDEDHYSATILSRLCPV